MRRSTRLSAAGTDEKGVWLVHLASASLILVAVHGGDAIRRALNVPVLRFLGRISFPVYAIHMPLIGSVASGAYILFHGGPGRGWAIVATLAVFFPVLIAASYGLALADETWNKRLNRSMRLFFFREGAPQAPGDAREGAILAAADAPQGGKA